MNNKEKVQTIISSARVIFWDFDGVIKDSVPVKSEAFRKLFSPYGKKVTNSVVEHHMANGGMSRYKKIPYYFIRQDKKPIFIAAIFENDQFCLITEEAKDNISEIHHRQPVIINQTDVNRYLNLELQGSALLKECNKPNLIFHEVSKDVNKPTNNSATLIQSV